MLVIMVQTVHPGSWPCGWQ